MARKRKSETTENVGPDPLEEMIGAALADDEGNDADAIDTALDLVDVEVEALTDAPISRGSEPDDAPSVTAESSGAPASSDQPRRRGRPAGSSNRTRRAVSDAGEAPKTKDQMRAAMLSAQAERDTARAEVATLKSQNNVEAIGRLSSTISAAAQMACNFQASRKGEHWRLTTEEARSLGEAWGVCLAPYADVLSDSAPWVMAIALTYNVFRDRIAIDKAEPGEVSGIETTHGNVTEHHAGHVAALHVQ